MKRWLVVAVEVEAATAGALAEVASTGVVSAEAASTAEDLAAEDSVTFQSGRGFDHEGFGRRGFGRRFGGGFGDYGFYGGCDPYYYDYYGCYY
jgi:hypothetical protein